MYWQKIWQRCLFSIETIGIILPLERAASQRALQKDLATRHPRKGYRGLVVLRMPAKVLRSYFPFGFNGSLAKVRILRGTI